MFLQGCYSVPRYYLRVAKIARGARVQIGVAGCAQGARVLTLVHTGPGSTESISAPGAGFPELQMRALPGITCDVFLTPDL